MGVGTLDTLQEYRCEHHENLESSDRLLHAMCADIRELQDAGKLSDTAWAVNEALLFYKLLQENVADRPERIEKIVLYDITWPHMHPEEITGILNIDGLGYVLMGNNDYGMRVVEPRQIHEVINAAIDAGQIRDDNLRNYAASLT